LRKRRASPRQWSPPWASRAKSRTVHAPLVHEGGMHGANRARMGSRPCRARRAVACVRPSGPATGGTCTQTGTWLIDWCHPLLRLSAWAGTGRRLTARKHSLEQRQAHVRQAMAAEARRNEAFMGLMTSHTAPQWEAVAHLGEQEQRVRQGRQGKVPAGSSMARAHTFACAGETHTHTHTAGGGSRGSGILG
jgi:hypothetical protein